MSKFSKIMLIFRAILYISGNSLIKLLLPLFSSLRVTPILSLTHKGNVQFVFAELLEQILSRVDIKTLVQCRRVNSDWLQVANKILATSTDLSMSFKYSVTTPPNTFVLYKVNSHQTSNEPTVNPLMTLDQLTSYFALPSTKFPCPSIRLNLTQGGHLTHIQVQKFVTLRGTHLNSLSLLLDGQLGKSQPIISAIQLITLKKIIFKQLPNLKKLTLNVTTLSPTVQFNAQLNWNRPTGDDRLPSTIIERKLSNLKIFRIGHSMWCQIDQTLPLLSHIWTSAPSLRVTQVDFVTIPKNAQTLVQFSTETHSFKVRGAKIYFSQTQPEILTNFAKLQIKFEELHLLCENQPMQIVPSHFKIVMMKILETSKNSLNSVTFDFRALILLTSEDDISMSLKGVQHFVFSGRFDDLELEIPEVGRPTNLVAIFPNLNKVELLLTSMQIEQCLGHGETRFDSVKLLILYCNGDVRVPTALHRTFPNVEHLKLLLCLDFSAVAKTIWKFKKVRKFQLELNARSTAVGNFFPKLDSAFTGLSEDTVIQLREIQNVERSDIEPLRECSSILNLSSLENLEISFRGWNQTTNLVNVYSDVMAKYAINLIPSLQLVKICTGVDAANSSAYIKVLEDALRPLIRSMKKVKWEPHSHLPQPPNLRDEYYEL